jgi:hypothetical protein
MLPEPVVRVLDHGPDQVGLARQVVVHGRNVDSRRGGHIAHPQTVQTFISHAPVRGLDDDGATPGLAPQRRVVHNTFTNPGHRATVRPAKL